MKKSLYSDHPQSKVQLAAITAGIKTLEEHDRARITMACGVGKTFAQVKLAEKLADLAPPRPKRILVQVPTLELIRQNQIEWANEHDLGNRYSRMCICSDASSNSRHVLQDKGEDAIEFSRDELIEMGVDPDSNAAKDMVRINDWLNEREAADPQAVSVIFTTYQSVQVVANAMRMRPDGDQAIDIGIFDEAHKTAGKENKKSALALDDANLQIGKRVFFTATERVIDTSKERDKDGEWTVTSMEDEAVYGPRAFNISFREAAALGIVTPYKIIISVINDLNFTEEDVEKAKASDSSGAIVDVRTLANMRALQRVMDDYNLKKGILFHKSIASAESFATLDHTIPSAQIEGITRLHVSGSQSGKVRRAMMDRYAVPGERSVISNAKCLTEGVNVPATDLVAFMDPKKSKVDIVQAVGRALRTYAGKETGYILLPLHISMRHGESAQDALDRAKDDFKQIRDVLAALAQSDDVLQEQIRKMSMGGGIRELPIEIHQDSYDGTLSLSEVDDLIRSIETRVVDESADGWYVRYGELVAFHAKESHCNVSTSDNLGWWVSTQRAAFKKGTLSEERIQKLTAIGFEFDPHDSQWNSMYQDLQAFHAKYRHCNVSKSDNPILGTWVITQRTAFKKGKLSEERVQKLTAIGFEFDYLDSQWNSMYQDLQAFHAKEGHCNVSEKDNPELGWWVRAQRRAFKKGKLSEERIQKLTAIGFEFDRFDSQWNSMYRDLQAFHAKYRHCNVSEKDNPELGWWVRAQRRAFKKGQLSEERIQKLTAIGFEFSRRKLVDKPTLSKIEVSDTAILKKERSQTEILDLMDDLIAFQKSGAPAAKTAANTSEKETRLHQDKFAAALHIAYGFRCALSGSEAALEAAHIHDKNGKGDWRFNSTKGILLSSTFHSSYDLTKRTTDSCHIDIDTQTGLVTMSKKAQSDPVLGPYHGKKIAIVDLAEPSTWPNQDAARAVQQARFARSLESARARQEIARQNTPLCPPELDDDDDDDDGDWEQERPRQRA